MSPAGRARTRGLGTPGVQGLASRISCPASRCPLPSSAGLKDPHSRTPGAWLPCPQERPQGPRQAEPSSLWQAHAKRRFPIL